MIVLVVLAGLSFAMPNLFYERVERHNDAAAEIEATGVTSDENAAALAGWPSFLPSTLVNLGLDLRGGAHLLAEVAVEDVYEARMDSLWPEVRDALRDLRDTVGTIRRIDAPPGELHVRVSQPEGLAEAVAAVRALAQPVVSLTGVGASTLDVSASGDTLIIVSLSEAERSATDDRTMQQSVEIVRRRVDEAGTREPTIQRQGADRILIQVPGIGSAQELKDLIGTTARLTFQPVVGRADSADESAEPRQQVCPSMDEEGVFYILEQTPVVTGDDLTDAQPSFDQQTGQPVGDFRFNPSGARAFGRIHLGQCGRALCHRARRRGDLGPGDPAGDHRRVRADLRQFHGGKLDRTGGPVARGRAAGEMTFLEERTIGPELGADSIAAGELAASWWPSPPCWCSWR
jgi:preprotein translocase subunit SecD